MLNNYVTLNKIVKVKLYYLQINFHFFLVDDK